MACAPDVKQVQLAGVFGRLALDGVQDQPVLARRRDEVLGQARVNPLVLVCGVPEAVNDALQAAKAHATHDGRLILDVANGNLRGAVEPPEELIHDLTMSDPESARPITKFVLRRARPADQLDELMFFYDEQDERGYLRRSTVELRLRWFTRFELELLLQSAGWQVDELYGNYDLEPYGPTSDRLLIVAR